MPHCCGIRSSGQSDAQGSRKLSAGEHSSVRPLCLLRIESVLLPSSHASGSIPNDCIALQMNPANSSGVRGLETSRLRCCAAARSWLSAVATTVAWPASAAARWTAS